jgi:hypothetical protein
MPGGRLAVVIADMDFGFGALIKVFGRCLRAVPQTA